MASGGPSRVVLILGTNYSGSHLLSHLLSAHPSCVGVGELRRFVRLRDGDPGAPIAAEYASDPLFAGLDEEPPQHWHARLARRLQAESPEPPTLIDNSKTVRWAETIAANPENEIHCLHLIRDPRALVRRWQRTYDTPRLRRTQRLRVAKRTPRRALALLMGRQDDVYVEKWLRANRQISGYLRRSSRPYGAVTYRDMVRATEPFLRQLMPRLGLAFHPHQLRFGEAGRLGTQKIEYEDAVRRSEIRFDTRWRDELSREAQARIAARRDVQEYLAGAGLTLVDDGLTGGCEPAARSGSA